MDASLVANECVDYRLKCGDPGVLVKIDLEKAYDHVNWNFLIYVLRRMGFGKKWYKLISWCILTPSFSILVNSSPCDFFPSSRGIHQWDPLSPLLFILVMEVSRKFIDKVIEANLVEGFVVGYGRYGIGKVSHLLFANDGLLFCGIDEDQMYNLRGILLCFEEVSSLKVNIGNSEIMCQVLKSTLAIMRSF